MKPTDNRFFSLLGLVAWIGVLSLAQWLVPRPEVNAVLSLATFVSLVSWPIPVGYGSYRTFILVLRERPARPLRMAGFFGTIGAMLLFSVPLAAICATNPESPPFLSQLWDGTLVLAVTFLAFAAVRLLVALLQDLFNLT